MAQTFKLTVAIPTYNRPDHIQRQVRDLLKQKTDQVEIIVRDNCSTVPVSSLFTEEEKKHFVIYRNDVNIGGEANQARCLEDVKEGWAWTLGDDDRITEDAIQTILGIINSHKDCCYINMCNKKEKETKSFVEFLDYFKIIGAFGIAFFQSANLFNMDKIRPYIYWFYNFLTSQVGQIIVVVKYLESNHDEKCCFTTTTVITDNAPGGWKKSELLINYPIVIDKFHYQKKLMKSNLFKGLGDMYFTILSQEKLTFGEHRYYLRYIIAKLGLLNIMRYNLITLCEYMLKFVLPKKLYNSLRMKVAKRYNKSKKDS